MVGETRVRLNASENHDPVYSNKFVNFDVLLELTVTIFASSSLMLLLLSLCKDENKN